MKQNKQNEYLELNDNDLQVVTGGDNSNMSAIVTAGVAGTGLGAGAVGLYARSKINSAKLETSIVRTQADSTIKQIQADANRRGVLPPSYEDVIRNRA